MSVVSPTYETLVSTLKRANVLGSISALVGWDEQVNLPPDSVDLRAEQRALLAEMLHTEATRPEIGEALATLEAAGEELTADQCAVVRVARRDYDLATRLPAEFVRRKAHAESAGYNGWVKARAEDDFASFAPLLQQQIELCKEEAAFLEAKNVYDFWIDHFDPGMNQATIERLFNPLLPELKEIVAMVEDSPVKAPEGLLTGFPEAEQEAFCKEVAAAIGFNFKRGRLDRSVHPFCGGDPRDTRMTTRFAVDDPFDSFSGVVHETGHGMYEQGLPYEHLGTALGRHVGMAIHESQSRLWENQVARGRPFWRGWEGRYRELFSSQLEGVSFDDLFLAINRVAVTPIRVASDEVTYNLHIMLRFEMEKRLFSGEISVHDVPELWNETSARILGYRPKSNKDGCMQDVHWSCGLFGYFPSYCLGNLIAAQLWESIRSDLPDLENQIEAREYAPLLGWLRKNIHSMGARYQTQELVERATGKPLSHEPLVKYLKGRMQPIYG
jgi:carboxypeptidase Taq